MVMHRKPLWIVYLKQEYVNYDSEFPQLGPCHFYFYQYQHTRDAPLPLGAATSYQHQHTSLVC